MSAPVFGLSFTECLLIAVVALLVVGPKELPGLLKKTGRTAGMLRRHGRDFWQELTGESPGHADDSAPPGRMVRGDDGRDYPAYDLEALWKEVYRKSQPPAEGQNPAEAMEEAASANESAGQDESTR